MKKIVLSLLFSLFIFCTYSQVNVVLPSDVQHSSDINSIVYSPSGNYILTAGLDNTAKLWSKNLELLYTIKGHSDIVNSAIFSPDEKLIVTSSQDKTLKICDIETGEDIYILDHEYEVMNPIFSSDSRFLISVPSPILSTVSTIVVWDLTTGKPHFFLRDYPDNSFISNACISPDNSMIVTSYDNGNVIIWDDKGDKIYKYKIHTGNILDIEFTLDGKYIVSSGEDSKINILRWQDGSLIHTLEGHMNYVISICNSPDGKHILSTSWDGTSKLWNIESGDLVCDFFIKEKRSAGLEACFSSDGEYVATAGIDKAAVWSVENKDTICIISANSSSSKGGFLDYNAIDFSPDNQIITTSHDFFINISNIETGELINSSALEYSKRSIVSYKYSEYEDMPIPQGFKKFFKDRDSSNLNEIFGVREIISIQNSSPHKNIILLGRNSSGYISHKFKFNIPDEFSDYQDFLSVDISTDSNLSRFILFTDDNSDSAKMYNFVTQELIHSLSLRVNDSREKKPTDLSIAEFSDDSKYIITYSEDYPVKIWDRVTGDLKLSIPLESASSEYFRYQLVKMSPDNKHLVVMNPKKSTIVGFSYSLDVFDISNGDLLYSFDHNPYTYVDEGIAITSYNIIEGVKDSIDKLVVSFINGDIVILNLLNGEVLHKVLYEDHGYKFTFCPPIIKDSLLLFGSQEGVICVWNFIDNKLIYELVGHDSDLQNISFEKVSMKRNLISIGNDGMIKYWDIKTGELLLTYSELENDNWIVYDKHYRYDGTPEAMNQLYFTCGLEIVESDQLKKQLYVPNLLSLVLSGDSLIDYPKLSELDICGTVPLIEEIEVSSGLKYKIIPRDGGLGDIEVYIGGTKYDIGTLKRHFKEYYFTITEEELEESTKKGKENEVKIVALTKTKKGESPIKSRGFVFNLQDDRKAEDPSFYALFIGVQDYKDDELDLQFTSKDATDLSKVVEQSAIELFGEERVHVSTLISGLANGDPSKYNIEKELHRIGQLTKPEDVVLVFFAGHGVMDEKTKNKFEFLCSGSTLEVYEGINTEQLMEWMSPTGVNNMKAQKRILIFDACNSGKINEELLGLVKREIKKLREESNRLKQLEELKDKSGLFILSASASNQSAFELEQLSQGLLTYCLLKTLKQGDVTDDERFLNVSKWFNETEDLLSEIITKYGVEQNAQPFGSGNIVVGELTEEIISSIHLEKERPLITQVAFTDDKFQKATILNNLVSNTLRDITDRGKESAIIFKKSKYGYSISGGYSIKDGSIDCTIYIYHTKSVESLKKLDIRLANDDLDTLSNEIIKQTTDWILDHENK